MGQVNQLSSQGRFMNRHSFAVFSGIVRENHWGSLIRIVPSYSTVSVSHSPSVPSSFCSALPVQNRISVSYQRPTSSSLFCPPFSSAVMGIAASGCATSAGGSRQ